MASHTSLMIQTAQASSVCIYMVRGEILRVDRNAKGELLNSEGLADVLFAPDVAVATDSNGKKTYYITCRRPCKWKRYYF